MSNNETGAPTVSVLIPTYNRPVYLRAALASVLAQSFGDFEVIVQDNASEIDPGEIIAAIGDPRIHCYRNAADLGITGNIVAAAAHARGKYVAILGDDDVWEPDFLSELVAPLEASTSLVLAFCDHGIIDGAGRQEAAVADKVTRRFRRHLLRAGVYCPFDEIALVARSICTISGAVLRRDDIDWKAIPVEMRWGVDLYLAYLAARTEKGCYYVPRRLSQYRYHKGSAASSLKRVDQRVNNARSAMLYWEQMLRDGKIQRNKTYFAMKLGDNAIVIAIALARAGRWREALGELRRDWAAGMLSPRILLYHLLYALRLHRATA